MIRRTTLPVLLYHHVGPARPATYPSLTVAPQRFSRQLDWLRRHGYHSLSMAEVEAWACDGYQLPPRAVVITFDDGYADLANFAFPLLRAAGFSAVIFVVTQLLGETNAWDPSHRGHTLLTSGEVKAWSKRGVEFGAHSRTHPNLDHLTYDQAEVEILGSRNDLEELVQQPVRSFAYPWGVAGPFGRQLAAENFALAFSDSDGPNTRDVDPHAIKRTMVQPTDGASDLNSRLRFGRSLRQDARARLGKVRSALRRTPANLD
jgi:peptidoglycan/xylan/chitin deacetylase (PgdA/CDA1 family)